MRTYQGGQTVVVHASGEDVRGACRILIHEDHDRDVEVPLKVTRRGCNLLGAVAVAHFDDHLVLKESGKEVYRSIQEATRIAAKVDNQTLHPLLLQTVELGVELIDGRVREGCNANISDAGVRKEAR